MQGAVIWRDIAIGLGLAIVGIALVLCVAWPGTAQPVAAQHAAPHSVALAHNQAAPAAAKDMAGTSAAHDRRTD
jgi:hypothetical protein